MMKNGGNVLAMDSEKSKTGYSSPKTIDTMKNKDSAHVDEMSDFPEDEDVFDMVKEVNLTVPLADITERYFTPYYRINFPEEGQDICLRMHTNRICFVSLAPSHAIFQKDRKIVKIDFQITDKLNRANNTVSGRAKHGAQPLHELSRICTISCDDGESWVIRCGMNGKLTEVNTDLLINPELLRELPHKGGYLAIILPKLNALEKLKNNLVTQEVYDETIRREEPSKNANFYDRNSGSIKRPSDNDLENSASKEKIMKKDLTENANKMSEKLETETSPRHPRLDRLP